MKRSDPPVQVGVEGLGLFGRELRSPPPPDPGGGSPDRGGRRSAATLHRDPLARASDPETSHTAAASMRDHAGAQRQAILEYLLAHPGGATADELDERLKWGRSVAGRRLGELCAGAEVVRLDGTFWTDERPVPHRTRPTRQGRQAFVHIHFSHLDDARVTE